MPWVPWLSRCLKNLARSCQDSQDASKRVNLGELKNVQVCYAAVFEKNSKSFGKPKIENAKIGALTVITWMQNDNIIKERAFVECEKNRKLAFFV